MCPSARRLRVGNVRSLLTFRLLVLPRFQGTRSRSRCGERSDSGLVSNRAQGNRAAPRPVILITHSRANQVLDSSAALRPYREVRRAVFKLDLSLKVGPAR